MPGLLPDIPGSACDRALEVFAIQSGQDSAAYEQRRLVEAPSPRRFGLEWSTSSDAEAAALQAAFDDAAGFRRMHFYEWEARPLELVQIGVGDGNETTFDLPAKETDGQTVYVAGQTVSFTVSVGQGAHGEDRVSVGGGAPAIGVVVTASATTARRRRLIVLESARLLLEEIDDGLNVWQGRAVVAETEA